MNVLIVSTNTTAAPLPSCRWAPARSPRRRTGGPRGPRARPHVRARPCAALKRECALHPPDVAGFSIRNIDNNDVRKPVAYYRDAARAIAAFRAVSNAPVILGGPAVAIMPEAFLALTGASFAVTARASSLALLLEALGRNTADELPGSSAPAHCPRA